MTLTEAAKIDVAVLVLGLDAGARAGVQAEMKRLAESGDTKTKEGLSELLGEAIGLLVREETRFTHAYAESTQPLPPEAARARFVEAAQRARSRFDVEVIRNADGSTTRRDPPPLAPSTVPGVVLVTLVVARTREIADVVAHPDRAGVRSLLSDLRTTSPADLVAIEVVWSPAEGDDRVTAEALETRHPEIRRLA